MKQALSLVMIAIYRELKDLSISDQYYQTKVTCPMKLFQAPVHLDLPPFCNLGIKKRLKM